MQDQGYFYWTASVTLARHTRLIDSEEMTPRQWHGQLTEEQGEAMIRHLIDNYGFIEKSRDTL